MLKMCSCGSPLGSNDLFCQRCGARVSSLSAEFELPGDLPLPEIVEPTASVLAEEPPPKTLSPPIELAGHAHSTAAEMGPGVGVSERANRRFAGLLQSRKSKLVAVAVVAAFALLVGGAVVANNILSDPKRSDLYKSLESKLEQVEANLLKKEADLASLETKEKSDAALATEVVAARNEKVKLEQDLASASGAADAAQRRAGELQSELDRLRRGEFGS